MDVSPCGSKLDDSLFLPERRAGPSAPPPASDNSGGTSLDPFNRSTTLLAGVAVGVVDVAAADTAVRRGY
jgi:hypothetical protein